MALSKMKRDPFGLLKHRQTGAKPFVCLECNEAFAKKSYLDDVHRPI